MMDKAGGGPGSMMFNLGKSNAKVYVKSSDGIKFSDVEGVDEAEENLQEIVDYLHNPEKYRELGARIPKGVLLVGPPGTGKTLIARAVAGESGVTFLYTSGSDFVEMFVGMGAARVRDLFSEARKKSPCIIFIDELDAVGRSRGTGIGGGHDEREQTLNQILVEMDGFSTDKGVIIMAATNRQDVLDDALLRPGRFDRRVAVELPDVREREAILQLHFAKVKTDSSLDFKKIARATPGSSGADLANLANESALLAARNSKPFVTMSEVEQARDKMVLGVARASMIMSPEAKTATAYHEAGHTLLHYYVEGVDPLHKVTVIPHGYALGVTISLPEDDSYSKNKQELLGRIKTTMGGYVAEELVYGQTTTGVSNDIKQATSIAQRMVTEFGMSKLGFVNYSDDDHPLFLGRDINQRKSFSEETAKTIDEEVRNILDSCLSETRKILSEHRRELDRLAQCLVERETLDDNQVREIIGLGRTSKNSDLFSDSSEKPLI
ncbi:MAG TPA: cell division protein FtsH, partial [Spirochaetaceae bacterium]|nr:cell division protein FtsH [Spirochaetaceae bacterium]